MFRKSNRGRSFVAGCGLMLAAIASFGSAHAAGYKVLYSFAGYPDGYRPLAALTRDEVSGRLYGTTSGGGAFGFGTIFALDPDGTETVLYSFTSGPDGTYPETHVLLDKAGNLFTTTFQGGVYDLGTIFELKADGTYKAVSFSGPRNGAYPYGDLIADSAGNLYGTTEQGGYGYGTVFEYQPGGAIKTLYAFPGADGGANPFAGLIQDAAGSFYGTTTRGGAYDTGTIFKLATDGTESVLYSFGGSNGAGPEARVLVNAAGDLFTTTTAGGDLGCQYGCGVLN